MEHPKKDELLAIALVYLEQNLELAPFIKARCYGYDGELIGYTYNIAATIAWIAHDLVTVDLHSDEEGGTIAVELHTIAVFDWYTG